MTSREAMIQQLKNLKGKPLKEKIIHIATYYWAPIATVLFLLVFVVSMIVNVVTRKDTALSLYCINSQADKSSLQEYLDAFGLDQGINMDENEIVLSATMDISGEDAAVPYESVEMLAALIAAQELDLMAGNTYAILQYAYQDTFTDLSQVFTEEQIEKYAAGFLYIDLAYMREQEENWDMEMPQYPDPTQPQTMEEPVPVAIWLPADAEFTQLGYPMGNAAMALIGNAPNMENALALLENILG